MEAIPKIKQPYNTKQRKNFLNQLSINADTSYAKDKILDQVLEKLGLEMCRGLFSNNIRQNPNAHNFPLTDSEVQLQFLNLIKLCHYSINYITDNVLPEQVVVQLNHEIINFLSQVPFEYLNNSQKSEFAKQLLAMITHRHAINWMCWKPCKSFTRTTQYLVDFLTSNLRSKGYKLSEISKEKNTLQRLQQLNIDCKEQLDIGTTSFAILGGEPQLLAVIQQAVGEMLKSINPALSQEEHGSKLHLIDINQTSIENIFFEHHTKILISQDLIVSYDHFTYLLEQAIYSEKPVTFFINSATLPGQAIATAQFQNHTLADYFNLVDINHSLPLTNKVIPFAKKILHKSIINFDDLLKHGDMISNIIVKIREIYLGSITNPIHYHTDLLAYYEVKVEDAYYRALPEVRSEVMNKLFDKITSSNKITIRFYYHMSEARELCESFVRRCNSDNFSEFNWYEDVFGRRVSIVHYEPRTISQFYYDIEDDFFTRSGFLDASEEDRQTFRARCNNNRICYQAIPLDLIVEMDSYIAEKCLQPDRYEVINPRFNTINYSLQDQSEISRLQAKISSYLDKIELYGPILLKKDNIHYTGTMNQMRYLTADIGIHGETNSWENDFYDGKLMLHDRYYDRQQMLLVLIAIKTGDEALFCHALANLASCLPKETLYEQYYTIQQVFISLFVTGKFPSCGLKLLYHHFMGRCGQLH